MKYLFILTFLSFTNLGFSQDPTSAKKLIEEGVAAHDRGDYDEAIKKYDQAIALDHGNIPAHSEKAMTLLTQKKADAAIEVCKIAIKINPKDPALVTAYVTLGTAYDDLQEPKKAIQAYNEGIKYFPDYYQLYFNRGITQSQTDKPDDAIESMKQSMLLNPMHSGSHNAMAKLLVWKNKKIPAIMAACRLLTLEPNTKRGAANLQLLQDIFKGNVTTGEKGNVIVNVSSDLLTPTKKGAKDDFNLTELSLMMSAGLDQDSVMKNKTLQEKFKERLRVVFQTLSETRAGQKGFFWDYYAPYFIELNEKGFLEILADRIN